MDPDHEREARKKPETYKCGRCDIGIQKQRAYETFQRLGIPLCKPCEDLTLTTEKSETGETKVRQRKLARKTIVSIVDVMMFARELKYLVEQKFKINIEYSPEQNEEWTPDLLARIKR